jgi:hypothetical protein
MIHRDARLAVASDTVSDLPTEHGTSPHEWKECTYTCIQGAFLRRLFPDCHWDAGVIKNKSDLGRAHSTRGGRWHVDRKFTSGDLRFPTSAARTFRTFKALDVQSTATGYKKCPAISVDYEPRDGLSTMVCTKIAAGPTFMHPLAEGPNQFPRFL